MTKAVAADLMACFDNLLNQSWLPFRHPTEDKECRFDFVAIQDIEHFERLILYSRRQTIPVAQLWIELHFTRVKVFLDVDRQCVFHLTVEQTGGFVSAPQQRR